MRCFYLYVVIVLFQIALCSGSRLFADGKILFVSDRDELANWDIYSMNSDGTGITRLTDAPSIENHPDLSPDGTAVVLSSDKTGNFEIYKAPLASLADENTWVQLTNFGCTATICIPGRHPHWSPDGTKIIYTAKNGCKTPAEIVSQCSVPIAPDCFENGAPGVPFERLHLMNSNGTNDKVLDVQSLDSRISHVGHPSFSSDGSQIIFTAAINKDATSWEVFVVDWNGSVISNLRQVTMGSVYVQNPNPIKMTGGAKYSPDGNWIYCSSTRTTRGNSQLFRIPANRKNPIMLSDKFRLTWTCGNDYVPTPILVPSSEASSNGQMQILFASDGSDSTDAGGQPEWDIDICVMNSDGAGRTNLTENEFPSETLLIADEVSWFCGLTPNLRECKFTLRAISIKSKFLMSFSENALPDDFPNKSKYPIYMHATGEWLAGKYPAYLEKIQRWLQEYMLPGADVHTAYRQIVIPSMMPVTEGCGDCVEVTTDTLPDGVKGKKYKVILAADQVVKYWRIIAGKLPKGLTFNAAKGRINGRPKETGTFPITVAAVRDDGNADSKDLSITIN